MADITPDKVRDFLSVLGDDWAASGESARAISRAYLAEHERAERLKRILAVERGDESQASEGWYRWFDNWRKDAPGSKNIVALVRCVRIDGQYQWNVVHGGGDTETGMADFYLEAMLAADAAMEARNG